VISSVLRLASLACIAVVVISFAAFASDRAGSGSRQTIEQLAAADGPGAGGGGRAQRVTVDVDRPNPGTRVEKLRERDHGKAREMVDDANDELTSPFQGVVSGDIWTVRIVEGLLALLVFGAGVGFLGRVAALRGV
jgi:hypothetical protein